LDFGFGGTTDVVSKSEIRIPKFETRNWPLSSPHDTEIRNVYDLVRFADEKMQKIPLFDSARYFCDLYCLKTGQDQRIHSHPESDKIYFVLSGSGIFHIAGEDRELQSGQAVVARPGQDHGVRNTSAEDLVLLVFMTPKP
jgi:mannose-6-phosphate isomerase-like protein (cupin superfamily)